jgi:zinc protease
VDRFLQPLRLPSRTRVLDNGLRVVVHEDRSAPIVAVHLMYHAGSKDEQPGRTGLAHLLEHLLFEGSEHCPKGQFDLLLEAVGGSNNGSTWLDRTNYYEIVPSHAVELALWLERERMAHFLPVLDAEMLELQRGVVINERLQSYDNRPYGKADERLNQIIFPAGHPYSWPTIGYLSDLRAITLDDARDFYTSFYTPRNAVLVLAGDIEPEHAFALADRYFGDLPAGPEPRQSGGAVSAPGTAGPPEQLTDRVSFARVYRSIAAPGFGHRDWTALDVLAYILADGESSRLERSLVRNDQLAQDVDTWLYPTEMHGIFGIIATARTGVTAEQLAEAIDRELRAIVEEGVAQDELHGAVRRVRRDHLTGLSEIEERAEALAYATLVLGGADRYEQVMNDYATITAEDVQRVAAAYTTPDRLGSIWVTPHAEDGHGS